MFHIRALTDLHFPPVDGGFKGSAWHGRIANGVKRHSYLNALFTRYARGQVAPWWIDAPEDHGDDTQGPFDRLIYPAGHEFELVWFTAGIPAEIMEAQISHIERAMFEVLQSVGGQDPASKWTDPAQRESRLCGIFEVQSLGRQSYPLKALQPLTLKAEQVQLHVQLQTMLRLDDGRTLDLARQALTQGQTMVPKLAVLLGSAIQRFTTLHICEHPTWDVWLKQIHRSVEQAEASAELRPVQAQVAPWDMQRWSAHAKRADPMGGLIGHIVFEGSGTIIGQAYPLLALAQWTRVGRKTALGAGRIQVRFRH